MNWYPAERSRRVLFLFGLMLVLAVLPTGCSSEEKQGTAVDISYLNKKETKLVTETHYLESIDTKDMIVEVLKLLCAVPDNKELKATLTSGINIITYSYDGEQVIVSLGEKYKELSRTTEVLTRAALVRSLTNIPGVNYVMITVNGEALTDLSGNAIGIMTADMFVDNAGTQVEAVESRVNLRLYFANETGDGLIAVNRELMHNADVSNVSMEKLVVEQLISGPANGETFPTISPDTKLVNITVKDGVCYLTFNSAMLTAVNNVTTDVTIFSIVNSLVELSNINKVQISIEGNKDGKFRDKYEASTVFERNLSLVN
ncbi:MAG: GerMN domain-containing protein [Lachnospiraceae bacterium]|jgi:germination protein M|nr:GerMN domain-containing protein [Lachnospiraceae bacterium]